MCIEDYRIGRLMRSVLTDVAIVSGGTFTIKPNPDRVKISFTTAGTVVITGGNGWITVNGVAVNNNGIIADVMSFSLVTHGDLPMKQFVINNGSNDVHWGIHELILPESALQEALEWLQRPYKPRL